jgi:hypothetical protein
MSELAEFNRLISQRIRELIPVQTVWATAKSIDWDKKTMIATGLTDDLDYEDVLLGLGGEYKKPKQGAKCLIGIVGNSANSFLITADEIDEINFTSGDSSLTIKKDGFVVKQKNESLKTIFSDMIDEINKIIVINGTSINVAAMTAIKVRLKKVLIE